MLFLSLLFILAGISLITAAGIVTTYTIIASDEKNARLILSPKDWPPPLKKWARYGGFGLASTLLGMILALIAT